VHQIELQLFEMDLRMRKDTQITATQFDAPGVHSLDVHTMDDLLEVHRVHQNSFLWDGIKKN
jgi:hypothetical protein